MAARPGNKHRAQSVGKTALQRFAEKCEFEPATGCVLWKGGTSNGKGNSTRYGVFWDGRRHFAHRWAAVHIHGIELGAEQAGHCCPHGPNSLCVQHLEGQTNAVNNAEKNERLRRHRLAVQDAATRQFYLFQQLGIYEPEPHAPELKIHPAMVPFYEAPEWFRPYLKPREANDDDCPF